MPDFDKTEDLESTVALTGDDLESTSHGSGVDSTTALRPVERRIDSQGHGAPHTVPFPPRGQSPTARSQAPTGYGSDHDVTNELPAAEALEPGPFQPPPFPPPPFARPPSRAPFAPVPVPAAAAANPVRPSPLLTSHVESILPAAPGMEPPSAFAPISTFPPAIGRSPTPKATAALPSADLVGEQALVAPPRKAPAWVVGYLVLCAALTIVGLVVLYFEHRMLGNTSPL
jgi:hypothetical protein